MKPDIEYVRLAVLQWCNAHRWDRDLPITPAWLLEIMTKTNELRDLDRKKIESEQTA